MDSLLPDPRTLRLSRSHFVRLAQPGGWQVRTRRGTLWITIDGEPEDIELETGESYTFPAGAPALLGSLGGDAVVTLRRCAEAPASGPGAWWQRLAHRARAA